MVGNVGTGGCGNHICTCNGAGWMLGERSATCLRTFSFFFFVFSFSFFLCANSTLSTPSLYTLSQLNLQSTTVSTLVWVTLATKRWTHPTDVSTKPTYSAATTSVNVRLVGHKFNLWLLKAPLVNVHMFIFSLLNYYFFFFSSFPPPHTHLFVVVCRWPFCCLFATVTGDRTFQTNTAQSNTVPQHTYTAPAVNASPSIVGQGRALPPLPNAGKTPVSNQNVPQGTPVVVEADGQRSYWG